MYKRETKKQWEEEKKKMTPRELEYLKASEDEDERHLLMFGLIDNLTGMNGQERANLITGTNNYSEFRKKFIEASIDHRVKIAKRMTDNDVNVALTDIRTVRDLLESFANTLRDEREIREKNLR